VHVVYSHSMAWAPSATLDGMLLHHGLSQVWWPHYRNLWLPICAYVKRKNSLLQFAKKLKCSLGKFWQGRRILHSREPARKSIAFAGLCAEIVLCVRCFALCGGYTQARRLESSSVAVSSEGRLFKGVEEEPSSAAVCSLARLSSSQHGRFSHSSMRKHTPLCGDRLRS